MWLDLLQFNTLVVPVCVYDSEALCVMCSHVQLSLYCEVRAAWSHSSLLSVGGELWVSVCSIEVRHVCVQRVEDLTHSNLFAVNGTWMGTTWWCLCRSGSFCLCLSLRTWVRIHVIPVHLPSFLLLTTDRRVELELCLLVCLPYSCSCL